MKEQYDINTEQPIKTCNKCENDNFWFGVMVGIIFAYLQVIVFRLF